MTATPIPSAPADLELIAQLKSRLQYAELKIRVLEERLRLIRRFAIAAADAAQPAHAADAGATQSSCVGASGRASQKSGA